MSSCPRRAPLADLSISPSPFEASVWPSSVENPLKPKPTNAGRVLLENASPESHPGLFSDGEGQNSAAPPSHFCHAPSSPDPTAVEIDACTPQAAETERQLSSGGEGLIIYNRLKAAAPSHLISSCPPPLHHLKTRHLSENRDRSKAVKRGFSAAMLEVEGAKDVRRKSRIYSVPSMPKKQWLPEDFVATQKSYFAGVDAFELSEEEGDLSDEV